MSKRQVVNEIHKPARKHFKRRSVFTTGIDDLWQADLVEMQPYADVNKDNRYLLTVIDVFSKFAFASPLKSKSAQEVADSMESIFKTWKRKPKHLQTDQGTSQSCYTCDIE